MPQSLVGTMILDAAKSAGLMGAVAGAVADIQGAPGAAKAAAGRAALKIPGVEKAIKVAKEGMNISKDIKTLATPAVNMMKKGLGGAGKAAGILNTSDE